MTGHASGQNGDFSTLQNTVSLPNTVSKLHYRWYYTYIGRFALHDNQGFQEWADCILKTD